MEGSTPTTEEMMRAQVLTLFSRCDHNVPLLIDRIVKALQDSGRHDLRFETDANGAVVTVAQSTRHAPQKPSTDFLQAVDLRLDPTRTGGIEDPMAAVRRANKQIAALDAHASTGAMTSAEERALHGSAYHGLGGPYPHRAPHRSFPETTKADKLASFPTSPYNGNYLLRRYGGAFPAHGNYGFYRRYGAAGQGARTAEYHNMPNGLTPDQGIYSDLA
jgi:hypothetical protein